MTVFGRKGVKRNLEMSVKLRKLVFRYFARRARQRMSTFDRLVEVESGQVPVLEHRLFNLYTMW